MRRKTIVLLVVILFLLYNYPVQANGGGATDHLTNPSPEYGEEDVTITVKGVLLCIDVVVDANCAVNVTFWWYNYTGGDVGNWEWLGTTNNITVDTTICHWNINVSCATENAWSEYFHWMVVGNITCNAVTNMEIMYSYFNSEDCPLFYIWPPVNSTDVCPCSTSLCIGVNNDAGNNMNITFYFGTSFEYEERELIYPISRFKKGANPPTEASIDIGATGNIQAPVYRFDNTGADEEAFFIFHTPKESNPTQDIEFHLVWRPNSGWTSGYYCWELEYLIKGESASYGNANLSDGTPTTISANATPANIYDSIETEFNETINVDPDGIIYSRLYLNTSGTNADDDGDGIFVEVEYFMQPNVSTQTFTNVSNGTYCFCLCDSLKYNTTYYWYVNVVDTVTGESNTTDIFSFTTAQNISDCFSGNLTVALEDAGVIGYQTYIVGLLGLLGLLGYFYKKRRKQR